MKILILAGIIFYLVMALFTLDRPLIGDDIVYSAEAQMPHYGLMGSWHPPLYQDVLRILVHSAGLKRENLRFFGIFCFLFTLPLIYLLMREVSDDRSKGILACLLYLVHPLAIQGSLIIDIDNTVLTLLLMLFLLYFCRHYENPSLKNNLFLGLLFFICLWAKLSTPVLLLASVFISYIFRKKVKKGIVELSVIAGVGIGLFLLLWFAYSRIQQLNFFAVFQRSLDVAAKYSSGPTYLGLKELGLRSTRIYLWLGPYFTILWALIVILRIRDYIRGRKGFSSVDFLIVYTNVVFFSYILVGGTCLGMAKYHYPIVSVICIIIAEFSLNLRRFKFRDKFVFLMALGLAFIFIERIIVKDLLYEVNYTLRELVISSPEKLNNFFSGFMKRMFFYHLPLIFGVVFLYFRNRKKDIVKDFVFLLLALIFIANLSLDIRQLNSSYFTTFCYGRDINEFKKLGSVFKEIISKHKGAIIIAPEDVLFNAFGKWYPEYNYSNLWNRRDKFIAAIKDRRVICVAYSFAWNAIFSFREIFFHPSVKDALEKEYEFQRLGSYSLWLRRTACP